MSDNIVDVMMGIEVAMAAQAVFPIIEPLGREGRGFHLETAYNVLKENGEPVGYQSILIAEGKPTYTANPIFRTRDKAIEFANALAKDVINVLGAHIELEMSAEYLN